jgi:hypothetical protein
MVVVVQTMPKTRVRCGKCGHVLRHYDLDRLQAMARVRSGWEHIAFLADIHGVDVEVSDADDILRRESFPCRKRCGAHYVVRLDRLEPKLWDALQARKDIVLGVDL